VFRFWTRRPHRVQQNRLYSKKSRVFNGNSTISASAFKLPMQLQCPVYSIDRGTPHSLSLLSSNRTAASPRPLGNRNACGAVGGSAFMVAKASTPASAYRNRETERCSRIADRYFLLGFGSESSRREFRVGRTRVQACCVCSQRTVARKKSWTSGGSTASTLFPIWTIVAGAGCFCRESITT